MRKIRVLVIGLIVLAFQSFGQNSNEKYIGYTDLEIETEKCLDKMFEDKGADFKELKTIFENYFSYGQISNSKDPIEKQYEDILSYWERPTGRLPLFKERKKVVAIREKLGLTEKDIIGKSQLDCLTNKYIENKAKVDTASSFCVFGAVLETIKQIPNISLGIIAGVIKMSMKKEDLKKELYQKAIVLLFCFDMTFFMNTKKYKAIW
jgi:hypothetical protein